MDEKEARFQVWRHEPTRGLYIVDPETDRAVGPVHAHAALRTFRLANAWEADGCDLGPWTWGFNHLHPAPLPYPAQEWTALEPDWLDPGVTIHHWREAGQRQVSCTSWEEANPPVDWIERPPADLPIDTVAESLAAAGFDAVIAQVRHGLLTKTWCGHPRGSAVLARSLMPGEPYAVVDLPQGKEWTSLDRAEDP